MASVNSTPSERVNQNQLNDTLLSANSSAFDVSGFSELPENFGISMNESLINAALNEEERVSTPKRKCVSKNPDYCESGDGDGLSDAVLSQEESVSTPKGKRKRKCVSKNPVYCESGEGDGLSDVDSDNDQSFIPPAESTPVGKRGRTQSQSPIRQKCGRKRGSLNKHQQFGKGVRSTSKGHGVRKPKPKDNKGKGKITPQTPEVISEVVSLVDDFENTGAKKHTMEEIRKSLKSTTSPVKRVRNDEPNIGVNRSKMREPRPNIWEKNVLKAARNSGKEYKYKVKKTKEKKSREQEQ